MSKQSEPRERLLRTAMQLFYREGIHAVGVDRLVAEAGVTRATFYRHFPSKEDLVEAYLVAEDAALKGAFAAASESGVEGRDLVELVIQAIADDVERNHTRGCPFINASAEYPDAQSQVRTTVTAHRQWFRETLRHVIESAGLDDAAQRAGALVLLRDAAMVGGYLDGAAAIRPTFVHTARLAAGL